MKISNQQFNYTQSTQTNTKIQHRNAFESDGDKQKKILEEKYTKIHQENLRQPDPEAHIFDKYTNPYEKNYVAAAASHYGPTYYELAKNGFDALPDLTFYQLTMQIANCKTSGNSTITVKRAG